MSRSSAGPFHPPPTELDVFGSNASAIGLYASTGYAVVTQQMRKHLEAAS